MIMKRAISLIELIISMSLMGVVILGATVFDASSSKFMGSSERKTVVTNELHLVLDYMQKDASNSTWQFVSVPVGGGTGLQMFQDLTSNPSNPGAWHITYVFGRVSSTSIERCDSLGVCVLLSQRFIAPAFNVPNTYTASFTTPTVRYSPSTAIDNSTNPQVSVPTVNLYAGETARQ